jgi:DNA-binding NarL/FixJ family response regulator
MATRILIVDDHQGILNSLVELLSSRFNVVGAVRTGESGFSHAVALKADIIILDISLPDIHGFEVAVHLRAAGCYAKIVFISSVGDPDIVQAAFELGASGYVVKSRLIPDLINAVEIAVQGAVIEPRRPKQLLSLDGWTVFDELHDDSCRSVPQFPEWKSISRHTICQQANYS